jgi:hypothetical protein
MTDTTIEVQFFDVGTWAHLGACGAERAGLRQSHHAGVRSRLQEEEFARWMTPAAWSGPENPRGRNLCGFCHTANFLEHGLIDKEHLRCCDEFRCYAE